MVYPKGSEAMLADNFEGKPFVRPNDLIADQKGGVYFTDPANVPDPSLPLAVYYLPPGGGKVIKVVDNVTPNGVTLSPDEKTLYVNSGGTGYVLAFDVRNDGTLTNRRNFAKYEGLTVTDGKVVGGGDGFDRRLPGPAVHGGRGENSGLHSAGRVPGLYYAVETTAEPCLCRSGYEDAVYRGWRDGFQGPDAGAGNQEPRREIALNETSDSWRHGARSAVPDVPDHVRRSREHRDGRERDQTRARPLEHSARARAFGVRAIPYLLFQVFGGWVGDRFGPRQTLFVCGVIWATATILTGLAGEPD